MAHHRGDMHRAAARAVPHREPRTDDYSEDGRCSVITDTDLALGLTDDEMDDDDAEPKHGMIDAVASVFSRGRSAAATADGAAVAAVDSEGVAALRQQLAVESQRRHELQETVERMQLGVDVDADVKPLEAALRKHHEGVNTLVAEVVQSSREARSDRTLAQLLDMMDRALLSATQEKQSTPCMRSGVPVERQPKQSCVVS
jgi:hypothetical protein